MRKSTIPVAVALSAMAVVAHAQDQDTQPAGNAIMTWKTPSNLKIKAFDPANPGVNVYTVCEGYTIETNNGQYFVTIPSTSSSVKAVVKINGEAVSDSLQLKNSQTFAFSAAQGDKLTITITNTGSSDRTYKSKDIQLFKQVYSEKVFQNLVAFNYMEITSQITDVTNELDNCALTMQTEPLGLIGNGDTEKNFPLTTYAQSIKDKYLDLLAKAQKDAEAYNNSLMVDDATTPALDDVKKKHEEFIKDIQGNLVAAQSLQKSYTDNYAAAQLAIKAANDTLAAIKDSIADPTKIFVPSVRGAFPDKNYAHDYKKIIDAYNVLATLQTYAQNDTVKLAASKKAADTQLANIQKTWANAKAEDANQQTLQKQRYADLKQAYDTDYAIAQKQYNAITTYLEDNRLDTSYGEKFKEEMDAFYGTDKPWMTDLLAEYDANAEKDVNRIWKLEEDVAQEDADNLSAELLKHTTGTVGTTLNKFKYSYEAAFLQDEKNNEREYKLFTEGKCDIPFPGKTQESTYKYSNKTSQARIDAVKIADADSHSKKHLEAAKAALKVANDTLAHFKAIETLLADKDVAEKQLNSKDTLELGKLYNKTNNALIDSCFKAAAAKCDTLEQSINNYEVYTQLSDRIKAVQDQYNKDLIRLTESLQTMGMYLAADGTTKNQAQASTYENPYKGGTEEGPVNGKKEIYKDLFDAAQAQLDSVAIAIKDAVLKRDSIYNADPNDFEKIGEDNVKSWKNYKGIIAELNGINDKATAKVDEVCKKQNDQDALKRDFDAKADEVETAISNSELNADNQAKAQKKLTEIRQYIYDEFVKHNLAATTGETYAKTHKTYMNQLLAIQKAKVSIDSLETIMKAKVAYKNAKGEAVYQNTIFSTTIDSINADITAAYDSIEVSATREDIDGPSSVNANIFPYTERDDAYFTREAARIAAGIKELAADKDAEQTMYEKYMAETADKVVNGALQPVPNSGRVASLKALYSSYAEKISVMTAEVAKKYQGKMDTLKMRIDHIADTVKISYTKDYEDKTGLDTNKYLNNNAVRAYNTNEGLREYNAIQNDIASLWSSAKSDYITDVTASNTADYKQALLDINNLLTHIDKVDKDTIDNLLNKEHCTPANRTEFTLVLGDKKITDTFYKVGEGAVDAQGKSIPSPDWTSEIKEIRDKVAALVKTTDDAYKKATAAIAAKDIDNPDFTASIKNLEDIRTALYGKNHNTVPEYTGTNGAALGFYGEMMALVDTAKANLKAYNDLDDNFHSHLIKDASGKTSSQPCFVNAANTVKNLPNLTDEQRQVFYDTIYNVYYNEFKPEHTKAQVAYSDKEATKKQSEILKVINDIHAKLDKLFNLDSGSGATSDDSNVNLDPSWQMTLQHYIDEEKKNGRGKANLTDEERQALSSVYEKAYNQDRYNENINNINKKVVEYRDSIERAKNIWATVNGMLSAANVENFLVPDSFSINQLYPQYQEFITASLRSAQSKMADLANQLVQLQNAIEKEFRADTVILDKHFVDGVCYRLNDRIDQEFAAATYGADNTKEVYGTKQTFAQAIQAIADSVYGIFHLDEEGKPAGSVKDNQEKFLLQIREVYDLNKMINMGKEQIAEEQKKVENQTSDQKPNIDANGNAIGDAGTDGAGNAIFDEPGKSENDSTATISKYTSEQLAAALEALNKIKVDVDSLEKVACHEFVAQKSTEFKFALDFADRYAYDRDSIIALRDTTFSKYKAEVKGFNEKVLEYETNYFEQVDELYNKYIKQVNMYMGYNHALKDGVTLNSLYAQEVKNAQASFYGIADSLRLFKNEATDSCVNATKENNYFDKDLHYWVLIGEMKDKLNAAYGRFLNATERNLDSKNYWNDEIINPWNALYDPALADVETYKYAKVTPKKKLTDVEAGWTEDVKESGEAAKKGHFLPQQYDALVMAAASYQKDLKAAYNDAAKIDIDTCRTYFQNMLAAYDKATYGKDVDFEFLYSNVTVNPAKGDNKTVVIPDTVAIGGTYGEAAQKIILAAEDDVNKILDAQNKSTNLNYSEGTLAAKHDDIVAAYEKIEAILKKAKAEADAKQNAVNQDSLNQATYHLVNGKYKVLVQQYNDLLDTIKVYENQVQDYVEKYMQDLGGADKDCKSGRLGALNGYIEDDYKNGVPDPSTGALASWEQGWDGTMKSLYATHLDRDTALINTYADVLTVIAHKAENAQLYYESNDNYRTVLGLYSSAMGLMGAYNRAEANVKDAESQEKLEKLYNEIYGLQTTFADATSQYEAAWGHESKSAQEASAEKTEAQMKAEKTMGIMAAEEVVYNKQITRIMNDLKDLDYTTEVYLQQLASLNEQVDSTETQIVRLLNQDDWAQYADRVFYDLTGRNAAAENYKYSVNKDLVLRSEYVTVEQNINKIYAKNNVTDEDIQSIKDQVAAYEAKVAARKDFANAQKKWYENSDAKDSAHVAIDKRSDAQNQVTLFLNKNCKLCAYEFAGRLQVVVDTLKFLGTKVDSLAKDTLLDRNFTVAELEWVDTELANIKSEAQARQAAYTEAINNVETPLHKLWALQEEIVSYGKDNLPSAVYDAIKAKMLALDTYTKNKEAILEFAEFKSEKVAGITYKNLWAKDGAVTPENYKKDSLEVEKGIVIANAAYDEMKQWAAKGDIDLNGEWLVNDYSMILKMVAAGKAYDATDGKIYRADVDSNENIDVADLTNEALLIMDQSTLKDIYAKNHKNAAKGATNTVNDQIMAVTDGSKIAVQLLNTVEYAALQMDITLPEGMTAHNIELAARANGFDAVVSTLENGKARVIVYNSENNTLVGTEGQVFTVGLNGTGNGTITIDNIILSDANGNRYVLDGVEVASVTAINSVAAESANGNSTSYDINGTIRNGIQKGVNIVRDAYNKVKKVIVK